MVEQRKTAVDAAGKVRENGDEEAGYKPLSLTKQPTANYNWDDG